MSTVKQTYTDVDGIELIKKFDTYIVELASRLSHPDKGMFGPTGEKNVTCLKGLTYLNKAVAARNVFFETFNIEGYIPSKETNDAARTLGELFSPINKVFLDKVDNITIPAEHDVRLIALAYHGIMGIEKTPICMLHKRIENFAKNTASKPGEGKLGIKTFKTNALAWLSTKGYTPPIELSAKDKAASNALELMAKIAASEGLKTRGEQINTGKTAASYGRLRELGDPGASYREKEARKLYDEQEKNARIWAERSDFFLKQSEKGTASGGSSMHGGYSKTRRTVRRNHKSRRTTKSKSRKTNKTRRHQ